MTQQSQQTKNLLRYSDVSYRKETGATYTPSVLATFVALQIAEVVDERDLQRPVTILDPACGAGDLLLAMVSELEKRGFKNIHLFGLDTNEDALSVAYERITNLHPNIHISLVAGDYLDNIIEPSIHLPIFGAQSVNAYDIIIANPPYVRTQVLGAKKSKEIAKRFGLKGRVDLYYPFILSFSYLLKPDGICGVITSNRFMTTKAGEVVRKAIKKLYNILHVWDFGDTKLFDAAVLPAVFLAKKYDVTDNNKTYFTRIYETGKSGDEYVESDNPVSALECEGTVQVTDGRYFDVKHGQLFSSRNLSDVWRISDKKIDDWIKTVENKMWGNFSDIGKIRVGVKTTADKVFIKDNWYESTNGEEPETLLPLLTHHVANRFRAKNITNSRKILYTHYNYKGKRKAIDFNKYPNAKKYLEQHREQLSSRGYLINSGRNWYEIWVPQQPSAWPKIKLVMRDISEKPCFWIDLSGSVVNGDCYWMIAPEGQEELLWLALGVGNSTFIEKFYDYRFNNKLYSGRRRFITQYVNKFPLPDPNSFYGREIIRLAKELYKFEKIQNSEMESLLNRTVYNAFGLS